MRPKKPVLILAFVVAVVLVLLLLPSTTLASAPWAPDFRLQEDTAYIFAYGDGSWGEVTDVAAGTFVFHWATYDDDGNQTAPAPPIPHDFDIVMQESWKGWTFGLMKTLPTVFEIQLSIPGVVDVSYEQAKAYWTGPFLFDQYWVNGVAGGEIWYAFNPSIAADIYANRWLLPLGKLTRGTYTVSYAERWVKEWTGMDPDYGRTHGGPWHARAGDGGSTSFTFRVK